MEFSNLTTEAAKQINNDLRSKISQGDYFMMPTYISTQSNEDLQVWVDKINPELLPSDYEQSMNKAFLRVVFKKQSLNPFAALFG